MEVNRFEHEPAVVHLFAGTGPEGKRVREELPVESLGSGRYRMLSSPGLVLGIAAGDTIRLLDEASGEFSVEARGGNIAIQGFHRQGIPTRVKEIFFEKLEPLRARLDGTDEQLLVFTVPVSVGFPALEAALNEAVAAHPGSEWYYSNVFGPEDSVTPLNWW